MNQQFYKNMALWVVILVVILLLVTLLRQEETAPPDLAYSEFLSELDQGDISEVMIEDGHITGKRGDSEEFTSYVLPEAAPGLATELNERGIAFDFEPKAESSFWRQVMLMWFPLVLFIGLWIFFIRQMQSGGGKAMSFGKSRARLLTENQHRVTFEDVAGIEESKAELEEIIAFLREPKKFTRLGGRIPKGVLLVGAPGTGKTLLARAVAGEAGVPFFSISGSDFVEMFVGVGASRVRDLFQQGKKHAPCIIFIDEIDAVGRHRGAGLGGGHDEREQTLNQLLVEMDGFESNEGVILIAATNRPDVLDPALLRPGRFDRRVVVPRPDLRGRVQILGIHVRRVPLDDDVDLEILARGTPGFAGADLQNLVNEAALLAARREATKVEMLDFENAKDKVLLGAERRSMIMSEEDKRITAYHEAGHALVAVLTDGSDPVHKVTIIPRGMALGLTQTLPVEDRLNYTRKQIMAIIKHAMGGRAAEEMVFGHLSTGASNDLQQATSWARRMICEYGMSERLGPVSYSNPEGGDVFLGRDFVARKDYSELKANEIDQEIEQILHAKYAEAKSQLEEHRDKLEAIAEALLERETLETRDLELLVNGEPLPPLPSPVEADGREETPETPSAPREEAGDEFPRQSSRPGADAELKGLYVADYRFALEPGTTTIVGVLNTTPDSFSDGGRFVSGEGAVVDVAGALAAAKELVVSGASIVDVGGESTRPGSSAIPADVELARTIPVIEALAEVGDAAISIDTRKAAVADAALAAGATIVNDVSGCLDDPDVARVAADRGAMLVIGHLRGTPADMQRAPHYDDVLAEVCAELASAVALAERAGVDRGRIVVDPGIGFGKRLEDNLALIAGVQTLRQRLELPVMLGPSRKAFLGALTGDDVSERDSATQATNAIAAFLGADALRVHDVAGARRAVAVGRALASAVQGGRA